MRPDEGRCEVLSVAVIYGTPEGSGGDGPRGDGSAAEDRYLVLSRGEESVDDFPRDL
jgi:hypothetical protein